jgi:hypothetical protein
MIESFVDLTYRGLSLGRRVKLSQVRPSTGYLETPAPMPVGTLIQIATDEGVALDATVTGIHEQTGGSDKAPGMTVAPKLAGEASEAWWRARVAYPDEVKAAPAVTRAPSKVTVRPRSHTTPEPLAAVDAEPAGGKTIAMPVIIDPEQTTTDVIPVIPEGKPTMIMPAADQELLESLTRPSGDIEQLTRSTGEHEIVDDGKRTTIMDAIDPASLGLDMSSSGSFPTVTDEDSGPTNGNGDDKKPPGGAKKKRKRR